MAYAPKLRATWAPPFGLAVPGNLDLNARTVYNDPSGDYRTENSITIGTDQGEVLIPTVVGGRQLSEDEAIRHYEQTGEHLGIFKSPDDAERYAQTLHLRQGQHYAPARKSPMAGFGLGNYISPGVGSWIDQRRNTLAGLGAGLLNGQPGAGVQAGIQADDAYATMQKAENERQKNLTLTQQYIQKNYPQWSMLPPKEGFDLVMKAEAAKLGGGTDEVWGLTPQAYEIPGPDGKPTIQIGVTSNKGNFKPVQLPEGANPVFPVQQLNTGTNFQGVDKFGRGTGGAIPIDNAGKSFAEGVGGGAAKSFQSLQDQAQGAYATLGQLSVMQNAMNDPNFYSGIGSDAVQNFKRVIVALGGDPNSVSSMETFGAAANKVILDGIGGSLGAQISNSDRTFIQNTAPNLGNTPEGNRQLIDIARKLANRKIEVAQLAADYVQKHGSLDANWPGELAQWAEANPLFGGAPAGGASSAPVVDMGGGVTIQEVP